MVSNKTQSVLFILTSLVFFLIAASGCNKESVTNVTLPSDSDTFTVSGRVVSYPNSTPISGAAYSILPGNLAGTTDQDGYLEVTGLNPGSYIVIVDAPGYCTSRIAMNLTVPNTKSNFNQHREFFLLENTGTLDLTVYGQDTGGSLSGVTVELFNVEFSVSGHQIDLPEIPISGQTDENGQVTLTGLPATRVWIAAKAFDADGDDELDYGTLASMFDLSADESSTGHMVMGLYTNEVPTVVVSNLPSGYNTPLVAQSIYLIFSTPMQITSGPVEVRLVQDNNPYQEIPMSGLWTSSLRLELTPMVHLTDSSMDYDFFLTVQSEDGYQLNINRNSIYWLTGNNSSGGDCEGLVTDLVASNPFGSDIDYDTRTLMLTWSAVSCSGGYRIYARDNRDNTQWVYLQNEPTDYETGYVSTVVSLPASFDRYDVDGLQTPFAGIDVSYCVVPLNATDPTPGAPHGIVMVADNHPPEVLQVQQFGNSQNNSGDTQSLEFKVVFSEFIAPSVSNPVIEVDESGGDPGYALDPDSATWVWNAGRVSGSFVFEIPDGIDASGDLIRIVSTGLTDLAGNLVAGSSTTDWQTVNNWGGSFDFEGSPQGWFQAGQGWQWGIPIIGPGGAYTGQSCWGTTLDANYENNWDTSLFSPELMVTEDNPYLRFWCWHSTDSYDDYVYVYAVKGGVETQLGVYHGNSGGWVQKNYDLSQFSGEMIILRFQFTSDYSGTYPGFFLDDVVIESN